MKTLLMHETTYNWLKNNLDQAPKIDRGLFDGYNLSFANYIIETFSWLKPTIDETKNYIFPKEKFVTYENKDIEWCEPLGIGRWGQGLIIGEIYVMDKKNSFPISLPMYQIKYE